MSKIRVMVILLAVVIPRAIERERVLESNAWLAHAWRMGLLSRFQARRTPAPAETGELWQSAVFRAEALSPEAHAVHVPGRAAQIVPAFALDFVLGCARFRPLAAHVAEYAELHHWSALERGALERLLPTLAQGGLLVSSTQLRVRLQEMHGPAGTIGALGMPTGGARGELVERTLRSFSANFHAHGRTPDLLVADSSADPAQTQQLRAQLRELRLNLPVLFAGEAEKRAFCAHLVQRGACAPETAEFAFLDPHGTGFICGGNRNTLLLHEAGRMLATVDDDVVCRLRRTPESTRDGCALFSQTDPFARRLYASREEALAQGSEGSADYLALHEALLGRGPGDLPLEPLGLEQARGPLAQRLLQQECRVRMSFTGHVGDPGIPTSAYLLYYEAANRERLCASEQHYRSVLGSRAVACGAPSLMLGDASVSPGMAMAFDQRTLLPPFFPVLHAEDFSYSAALWQSCPEALFAHTPWAVRHEPPPGKGILLPREIGPGRRAAFFEFAHLLRWILFDVALSLNAPAETRLRILGRSLEEIGALSAVDFRGLLVSQAVSEVSGRVQYLTRQLDEAEDAPDFWRADVEHLIEQLTGALEDEAGDVPLDLQPGRTPTEARALLQRLLGSYGALLQAWPGMVQATLELRAQGITLMQPA